MELNFSKSAHANTVSISKLFLCNNFDLGLLPVYSSMLIQTVCVCVCVYVDWTKGPLSAGWRKLIQQIAGGLRPAPSPAPLQSQTVHIHWGYLLSTAHTDCRLQIRRTSRGCIQCIHSWANSQADLSVRDHCRQRLAMERQRLHQFYFQKFCCVYGLS